MADTHKLSRLLVAMGYGTRREVESLILTDRVLLNGEPIDDPDMRVTADTSLAASLSCDGEAIDPMPGMLVMLHKPTGVTCSHKEAGALVYDLLPPRWKRRDPALSTIGRLDKDTSGLLLLTDDGALLHKIISPKHHVAKRYQVTLDRPLRGDEAAALASGTLMLDGEEKPLLPVEMETHSATTATVTLHEGRYHQVRRMFAALGNHVVALHRISIGGLLLPESLNSGSYQLLTPEQTSQIFSC